MTVIELPVGQPRLAALYAGYGIFPRHVRTHKPWELAGRDQDLAIIGSFADRLPVHGGALLVSGEPGIGKSALLDAAEQLATAAGIRVIRAAGADFEDVSYFGLNQLLLPLRGDLNRLDRPQRNALNVALGFSDGPAYDRLVVSNAALALLCQAAADRPLLLIVDNLQWVDEASALVLGFIARRLQGSRVGIVAAERTGASRLPALDIPRYEMQPTHVNQARRLATAAYLAASVTGDLSVAEALLAGAWRACPDRVPPAEIALATGFGLLHGDGDVATAHRVLLRSIRAARDDGSGSHGAQEALGLLVYVCRMSGSPEHWESLERFIAKPGSEFPADAHAAIRIALDPEAARGRLNQDVESLGYRTEPAEIVRIASAATFADRLPDCRQALRRVAYPEPAATTGAPAMQARVLLALEAYLTGQWDEAWQLAQTSADLCASRGYQLLRQQAETVLAFVAACRGDAETARAHADEITRWAAPRGVRFMVACANYAYVLTALAQSDFQTAYHQATRISPAGEIASRDPFAGWAVLDLVEAALRTDRREDAAAHVRAVGEAGLAAASPRMALLSTAAMAMTAPDDEAPALFDRALASADAERWPFDGARVHLLFGERLRRMRAVTPARVHLGAALDEFRRLGAPTWADRAATALRATGQVRQRVDRYAYQVLTSQELQIARLAATGLSNKQIADRLFMSHRTVGSHLYRIFPKLGVTSRAALSGVLPRPGED
jgi:DNA-binding CsgD family transcriptional regulator